MEMEENQENEKKVIKDEKNIQKET